jgi:mRNA interferase MazF
MCVPLTSNLKWALAPGNIRLTSGQTGLPKPSVALVCRPITVYKHLLLERVSRLPRTKLDLVLSGIDVVLGR